MTLETAPPASARYPHRIPVRVTTEEKRKIDTRARASNLSASRYLALLATCAQMPPTTEEKKRLAHLLYLFKRAAENVRHMAASVETLALSDEARLILLEVRETGSLLEALANEIGRRI